MADPVGRPLKGLTPKQTLRFYRCLDAIDKPTPSSMELGRTFNTVRAAARDLAWAAQEAIEGRSAGEVNENIGAAEVALGLVKESSAELADRLEAEWFPATHEGEGR